MGHRITAIGLGRRTFPLLTALCLALLPLAGGLARAQAGNAGAPPHITLVEPPAPLLPTDATLTTASDAPAETAETAAVLAEDGLSATESRGIAAASGAGWVKAYRFGDATGAYAAYTYFRSGARPVAGGVNASDTLTPGGERVLLSGVSVVRMHAGAAAASALLRQVATGLPKVGGRTALAPLLPTYLPPKGLDKASVRYALGPKSYEQMGGVLPAAILGWEKSGEAVTADYGGKGKLTLLLYPTPQIAGDRGRAIEKAVNEVGSSHFGTVKMKRVGPLVAMTSGEMSVARAVELMTAVRLDQVVTFDQKMPLEFHTEVRKTASLLQNIAVLCGVLILGAVLLGVFLGGARAGIRVLQGKPAASEPEFLSIDLRGRPEPLHRENEEGRI